MRARGSRHPSLDGKETAVKPLLDRKFPPPQSQAKAECQQDYPKGRGGESGNDKEPDEGKKPHHQAATPGKGQGVLWRAWA